MKEFAYKLMLGVLRSERVVQ